MRTTTSLMVVLAMAAASCGGKIPGSGGMPGMPGGLPSGSGEVDPNTCGNYAASDAGAKLKIFLQSIKDLQVASVEMVKVVKQSCVMMGQELGMPNAELDGDDTNGICAKVITTYQNNLKVAFKANARVRFHYKPAECKVDVHASASASGACSGAASAGTGGSGGGGSCAAAAQANASLNAQCTPPEFSAEADAKIMVDTSKAEMTLKALRDGLPKLFSATARAKPLLQAAEASVNAAKDLAAMGPKFVQSFGDQALCISGQLAAAASAATNIQANVSVSVSVSASASGSVGGG